MAEILTDLSTPTLTRAIKANLLAFFRYLGRSPHTLFHEEAKLIRWYTPVPHPWFNGVLSLQPASANEDAAIKETLAFFKAHQAKTITWWLDPDLPSTGWDAHLRAHGFGYDTNIPGMAVDLQAFNEEISVPAEFQLNPVENLETLAAWTRAFIGGYQLPLAWETDLFRFMASLGLALPIRYYLGCLDGRPVATSSLFLPFRDRRLGVEDHHQPGNHNTLSPFFKLS
jgi:hypothetical protein